MSRPKHILVRGPNWIGDHVMAQPFYAGLRSLYSDARITLMVAEAAAEVYGREYFDEILPLAGAERKVGKRFFEVASWLRAKRFDLGITLPASLSSSLLLFWARIPARIGFAEDAAGFFLTTAVSWRGRATGDHKSAIYRDLLDVLSPGAAAEVPFVSPVAERSTKLVVVAPGAANPLREWPYFPELFETLPLHFPEHRFVAVGGPGDTKWKSVLHRFNRDGRWEDRIGQTTLAELGKICGAAELVVANDSGVAHFAAQCVGAPVLVLFGPGDPDYVRPLGRRVRVAREPVPCSPCESAHCRAPFGYQRCLRELTPKAVLNAVHDMVSL